MPRVVDMTVNWRLELYRVVGCPNPAKTPRASRLGDLSAHSDEENMVSLRPCPASHPQHRVCSDHDIDGISSICPADYLSCTCEHEQSRVCSRYRAVVAFLSPCLTLQPFAKEVGGWAYIGLRREARTTNEIAKVQAFCSL